MDILAIPFLLLQGVFPVSLPKQHRSDIAMEP